MAMQGGRGGGPAPKGAAGAFGGLLLLGGLSVVGYNSLFNVDGGHRAIKYTRIGGVSKEIYAEGMEGSLCYGKKLGWRLIVNLHRNTFQDPLVRDAYRLRCSS